MDLTQRAEASQEKRTLSSQQDVECVCDSVCGYDEGGM